MRCAPTYEVLVVDEEGVPVAGEVEPEGAERGQAGPLVLPEQGVPEGQQGVALAQGVPHVLQRLLPKVPRLPPLGVDVRVGPEEGLQTHLVPAHTELCIRVLEESANVCAGEGDASHAQREDHGHRDA
ncbi:unnamed protein product, partial [Ixodes persulcatus]